MSIQKREGAAYQKWAESCQGRAWEVVPALWAWSSVVKDSKSTLLACRCVLCGYFFSSHLHMFNSFIPFCSTSSLLSIVLQYILWLNTGAVSPCTGQGMGKEKKDVERVHFKIFIYHCSIVALWCCKVSFCRVAVQLVSAVQWSESAVCINISPSSCSPPSYHPSRSSQYWAKLPQLYIQ